ncbi:MAG: hypothetical protein B7X41_10335, partial [Microbacterium sp. 14-71-5]
YAILDRRLRHLPGGVDEYLRLRALEQANQKGAAAGSASAPAAESALSGADRRTAEKELTALERRMQKLAEQIDRAKHGLADHDQSDYAGLGEKMKEISAREAEVEELELRWFELTEQLG